MMESGEVTIALWCRQFGCSRFCVVQSIQNHSRSITVNKQRNGFNINPLQTATLPIFSSTYVFRLATGFPIGFPFSAAELKQQAF
jgi:hypothetical protein